MRFAFHSYLARLLALAASLVLLSGTVIAAPDATESRVALVIGNGGYRFDPLRNPVNDARAMAKALQGVGFEVLLRENLNQRGLLEAVREFSTRLREGGVGLFYFAGHGVQVNGRNFLIPVDADIQAEEEVPYQSMDANLVLDRMDRARTRVNLMVLDACRNNPFARSFRSRSTGLAQMEAPSGTLIAFATAPGSVAFDGEGQNSIYTRNLVRNIDAPDQPVEVMFKRVREAVTRETGDLQVPWESSSLKGDFFFRAVASAASAAGAITVDPKAMEYSFWESIRNSTNPADFRAYLEQFPQGTFAALARNREQALRSAGRAEAPPAAAKPGQPQVATPTERVALAPPIERAKSGPRPVVGDTWTYQLVDSWTGRMEATFVHRITAAGESALTEEMRVTGYPALTDEQVFAGEARMAERRGPRRKRSEFNPYLLAEGPVDPGRTWSGVPGLVSEYEGRWDVQARVVGTERVKVPAGEFDALKVEVTGRYAMSTLAKQEVEEGPSRFRAEYWYAAQAKRIVRSTWDSWNNFGRPLDRDVYELSSYRVQ